MFYRVFRQIDELGRIVIPKELRERFGMKSGDEVMIEFDEDGIIIHPEEYYKDVKRNNED
jgi:AbrB family looped-hinge helix DNA binding protein